MNPKDCFYFGPYTSPECVPWPKNVHEEHVIAVIWLVTWTLGIFLMLWMDYRLAKQVQAEEQRQEQDRTPAFAAGTSQDH
jgi:hypothetical protein